MKATMATESPFRAAIAISLLAFTLLTPVAVAGAQDDGASGTLRERFWQRRASAQQNKPAPQSGPDAAAGIDRPGDHVLTIEHDGLTRAYRVHVPEKYRAASPAPLLVAFHGGGGDMNHQARDESYGLISKSEAEVFVVVFPNGFSKLASGKFATWNVGTCCAAARDQNVDDVGFVRRIIGNITGLLNIDRSRIYATGMSNGGMMAYRLACEMADTFSAIAAVAGTDNTTRCTPRAPIAILHIHASNDDRVLYDGGAGSRFSDPAKVAEFTSVPATLSKWVGLNGCNAKALRVLDTPGARCDSYSQCRGNVEVRLCVTETGGHSWPGGNKARGSEPASQALSANDVMWAFFTSAPGRSTPAGR